MSHCGKSSVTAHLFFVILQGSGSGDKPDVQGKAKLLLDVCEILHVLEIEEEMKAPEEKRDLKAIAESMKVVCEMAYDELEADDE